jgi:hypothetical protein
MISMRPSIKHWIIRCAIRNCHEMYKMGYISAHDFMSIKISDLRSLRNGLLYCENARRYLQCYVIAEVQEREAR